MSSINVNTETKTEFDELKPDELTQDEFVQELIAAYRRDDGEIVDIDEIVDEINHQIAAEIELSAYRGTKEALNDL